MHRNAMDDFFGGEEEVLAGNLDRPGEPARASVMAVLSVGSRGSLEAAQGQRTARCAPIFLVKKCSKHELLGNACLFPLLYLATLSGAYASSLGGFEGHDAQSETRSSPMDMLGRSDHSDRNGHYAYRDSC
jgi:hypothetical protein